MQRLILPKAKLRESWQAEDQPSSGTDARINGVRRPDPTHFVDSPRHIRTLSPEDQYSRIQQSHSVIPNNQHHGVREITGSVYPMAHAREIPVQNPTRNRSSSGEMNNEPHHCQAPVLPERRGRRRGRDTNDEYKRRHKSLPARDDNINKALSSRETSTTTSPRKESLADMKQKQLDCHQKLLQWQQEILIAEDLRREQLMLRAWHLLSIEGDQRDGENNQTGQEYIPRDSRMTRNGWDGGGQTRKEYETGEKSELKINEGEKKDRKEYRFITKSGQVKTTRRERRLTTHPRRGETVIEIAPRRHKRTSTDNDKRASTDNDKRTSEGNEILENGETSVDGKFSQRQSLPISDKSSHQKSHEQQQQQQQQHDQQSLYTSPKSHYHFIQLENEHTAQSARAFKDQTSGELRRREGSSSGIGSSFTPTPPLVDFEREIEELEDLMKSPRCASDSTTDWRFHRESATSSSMSATSSSRMSSPFDTEVNNNAETLLAMMRSQPVEGVVDESSRRERNRVLGMAQVIAREAKCERKERKMRGIASHSVNGSENANTSVVGHGQDGRRQSQNTNVTIRECSQRQLQESNEELIVQRQSRASHPRTSQPANRDNQNSLRLSPTTDYSNKSYIIEHQTDVHQQINQSQEESFYL